MSNPSARKFTIADAMVLVAATAVGLGAARWVFQEASRTETFDRWFAVKLTLSCLGPCWSAALLALRMRRPRPGPREVFRQPGAAAAVAVLVMVAFLGLFLCIDLLSAVAKDRDTLLSPEFVASFMSEDFLDGLVAPAVAPAVAAVWLVMALGGRWEPEASWVDRSGRVLGWFWLGTALVGKVYDWVG